MAFFITPNYEGEVDDPFILCRVGARAEYVRVSQYVPPKDEDADDAGALKFDTVFKAETFIEENPLICGDVAYILESTLIKGQPDYVWVEDPHALLRKTAGR